MRCFQMLDEDTVLSRIPVQSIDGAFFLRLSDSPEKLIAVEPSIVEPSSEGDGYHITRAGIEFKTDTKPGFSLGKESGASIDEGQALILLPPTRDFRYFGDGELSASTDQVSLPVVLFKGKTIRVTALRAEKSAPRFLQFDGNTVIFGKSDGVATAG